MASFNPYLEWLGIRSSIRPLDHYTLLNLPRFEADPAGIRRAADAQKSRIRSVRPGSNMADWQRLLDEIEAAADCLTTSAQKAPYDTHLRELPLPDESVLDDPAEQAAAAASSIIAGSAESHLNSGTTSQQSATAKNAAASSNVAPQPTHNLMPPTFAPSSGQSDTNQPPEIQKEVNEELGNAVLSLTSNPMPPTFGDGPGTTPTTTHPEPTPPAPAPPPPPNPAQTMPTPAAAAGTSAKSVTPPANPAPLMQTPNTPETNVAGPANVAGMVTGKVPAAAPSADPVVPPADPVIPPMDAAPATSAAAEPTVKYQVIPIDELLPPTAVSTPGLQPPPTHSQPVTHGPVTHGPVTDGPVTDDMAAQMPVSADGESPNATVRVAPARGPHPQSASKSRLLWPTTIAIAFSLLMLVMATIVYVVDKFASAARQQSIALVDGPNVTTDSPTIPSTSADGGTTDQETPASKDPSQADPTEDPSAVPTPVDDPDPTPAPDPDAEPETDPDAESVVDPDPVPDPMPMPESPKSDLPQITAQQLEEIEGFLFVAKQALKSREPRRAIQQVAHARAITAVVADGPHAVKVEQMRLLSNAVGYFWDAVAKGMEDLSGQDLKIGSTTIHIQDASPDVIRYRRSGTNEVKTRVEMPPGLIRAIAEHWLDDSAASQVLIGAFMAVESRYGPDRAREVWQGALDAGEPISAMMPILDEL